jgi:hypothetical protein
MRSKMLGVLTGVAVLLALGAALGFADYDKATMQTVMRNNLANLPKLNAAAGGAKYMEAAGYLISISQGMYSIKDYTPPKGEKAKWDETIGLFLKATWRGLAACADENQANLRASVTELQRLMQVGHTTFR